MHIALVPPHPLPPPHPGHLRVHSLGLESVLDSPFINEGTADSLLGFDFLLFSEHQIYRTKKCILFHFLDHD